MRLLAERVYKSAKPTTVASNRANALRRFHLRGLMQNQGFRTRAGGFCLCSRDFSRLVQEYVIHKMARNIRWKTKQTNNFLL
ncbi:hypothetical protein [Nostoc piscinale]|uniref:hypothetical protein n=1 Tax=Nostoc piscinale TaxID=224012 RepID=UPI00130D86E5|nr:hypothetical protein [Nostoc piscinale]